MLGPPFIDLEAASWVDADTYVGRDDGRRFENWERSFASQIGLGRRRPLCAAGGHRRDRSTDQSARCATAAAVHKATGNSVHDLGVERCEIVTFRRARRAIASPP